MGLIYVNPQGPDANPNPLLAAHDIRETFGRMAMNDYETVALVAGGHTFGKSHGAAPESHKGPEPEGSRIQDQATGWNSNYKSGLGVDTISSGIEGAWTTNPIKWDMGYFDNLFGYEWELTSSPAGAHQWKPKRNGHDIEMTPDAHEKSKKNLPMMQTTDLSLKMDPNYGPISRNFHENPDEFADAFARAWFKLTHRDMGPRACYLGTEVPKEKLIWQDPVPAGSLNYDLYKVKEKILSSNLSVQEMVETAWASASTYRNSDMRGGANGARLRLEPQKDWEVNKPKQLEKVLKIYESISKESGASVADVIILAGNIAIEKASGVDVPFTPGRGDATQKDTDVDSFDVLEPKSDGFRNFHKEGLNINPEEMMLDKAQLLGLTAPELTVLIGGLRSIGISSNGLGLFSNNIDELSNDYFKTLLDMSVQWSPNGTGNSFEATNRLSGEKIRTASRIDLVFGSNSQLRALVEVYASDDGLSKFKNDFVKAWNKVMNADRFELEIN